MYDGEPSDGTSQLADWRRQVNDLYSDIRRSDAPEAAWRHWCSVRDRLFAEHPQSPLAPDARADFDRVPVYDYDPAFRFLVTLAPVEAGAVEASGGNDGAIRMRAFAVTRGLDGGLGRELTLYWIEGYGGGVFLPFKDATSGTETFGGGRYLLDGIKGADLGTDGRGRTILDFNFAYHPSCCHSPQWTCPLAPRENTLEVAVTAGERL